MAEKRVTGDNRIDSGWFSRRHQTSAEHQARQTRRVETQNAALLDIADRILARANRTPAEQIALLDSRLGVGVGAKRERARLQAQIVPNVTEATSVVEETAVEKKPKRKSSTRRKAEAKKARRAS